MSGSCRILLHSRPYGLRSSSRTFPDIENFPLKPIALGQDLLPPAPAIQGPPPQLFTKRYDRCLRAPSRGMLEIIPLMLFAVLEEPPIEMIVNPL